MDTRLDGHQVDFDEAIRRSKMYEDIEKKALRHTNASWEEVY